jgi:hypothetical protein
MTADEIIAAIAWQTKALRDHGRTPVAVEIGREQDAALSSEKGFTSNLLMVTAPGGAAPSFRAPGQPFPATQAVRVQLCVKRVDQDSCILVTD